MKFGGYVDIENQERAELIYLGEGEKVRIKLVSIKLLERISALFPLYHVGKLDAIYRASRHCP